MRQVWLIRHGESAANAGLATQDAAAIPLTARGRAQAELVARALPGPPDLLVSSSYVRAADTAAPARARFPESAHAEWPVHEFTYLAGGAGAPSTVAERRPRVDAFWARADPHHVDGEGAESFVALLDRVEALLVLLGEFGGKFVAVYTHGLFMRTVLWSLVFGRVPRHPEGMRRFRLFATTISVPNAAILRLYEHAPGAFSVGAVDTSHLPAELVTGE
ncbi:MAG TPA: histidine phosphatase family protein [Polyangiaceae bacterium]|nr:histidine phosphatase family protein [Polyangiaceae bacterium]